MVPCEPSISSQLEKTLVDRTVRYVHPTQIIDCQGIAINASALSETGEGVAQKLGRKRIAPDTM